MKIRKILIMLILFCLCLFFSGFVSAADETGTIINLNNNKSYTNLQEAINDPLTTSGNTIQVQKENKDKYQSMPASVNITPKPYSNTGNTSAIIDFIRANMTA